MFARMRGFFMGILGLFRGRQLREVAGIGIGLSQAMYDAIGLWSDMAGGCAPWNADAPSCGILGQISGRLGILVSREIGLVVENEAIRGAMERLNSDISTVVDYMALLGGCVVRPIFAGGRLQYETIPLGNYLPLSYDFDGTLTGALILKRIETGASKWLLTERHEFAGGSHSVECALYRDEGGSLIEAPLSSCPMTAELTPFYVWKDVGAPMIVEFRNHAVNRIDGSRVPVPVIAGAEDLIRQADEQFERMNWEQEAGEKTVFADRDMFRKRQKRNGEVSGVRMTPRLSRLVVQVEGDGISDGKKISEWSPELRTSAQVEMFQQILRRIELACCLGKGTLSDMESVQQTATQYSGGRSELFAIVDRIEDEIERKYQRLAEIFAYMAAAYGAGANDARIRVTWNNDATRKDETAAKQMALQEIGAGVKNKWEYRRDFYGEDEEKAKESTPEDAGIPDPFGFGA